MRLWQALALTALCVACSGAEWGVLSGMHNYEQVFGVGEDEVSDRYRVVMLGSNAPGHIFYPDERPRFRFQMENLTDERLRAKGRIETIRYAQLGRPGDNWTPELRKLEDVGQVPLEVDLGPGEWENREVQVGLPQTKGGYGLVIDLGEFGRRYLVSCTRAFKQDLQRIPYPKQAVDAIGNAAVLERLGIQALRFGVPYIPTDSERFEEHTQELDRRFSELHRHKITATVEIGSGHRCQPLGRGRPHLDEDGVMQGGKQDLCWLPECDDDYEQFVYELACRYGWPKGPINGFMLWNEPWEGKSISGWQADMLRYRNLYRRMAEAVVSARKDAGVQVLVGGCDSSSNTWDKLFGDGSNEFLPYLDFCSIHYQGLSAPALHPMWLNRRGYLGRVRIWDTESWFANTDDRFLAAVAACRAAGYDRTMCSLVRNAISARSHNRVWQDTIRTADGDERIVRPLESRPLAAVYNAAQRFIGEREFKEILFKRGLPWVFVFGGLDGNKDDGTVVVVGDLARIFHYDNFLYHTVRSLDEVRVEEDLRQELNALGPGAEGRRRELEAEIAEQQPFSGARMVISAEADDFHLHDYYGNALRAEGSQIEIPLEAKGFFLRADPSKAGSFDRLVGAIRDARVEGIEPVEMIPHDMTEPIERHPTMRVRVTNMLGRPVSGALSIRLGELGVEYPGRLQVGPRERQWVSVDITGGKARADNTYRLSMVFDAGTDGRSVHHEDMHVNWISRQSIDVDGSLDDWEGAVPQTIVAEAASAATFEQQMWMPYEDFGGGAGRGLAIGYMAYDDRNFYFGAKIADDSVDPGSVRFEDRDDDAAFYPEVCYDRREPGDAREFSVRWTGFVVPPVSGTYTFSTVSDDGVRLWVNGEHVIDNWTPHGDTTDSGEIELEAGEAYPVKLEYFQGGGGATLRVLWKFEDGEQDVLGEEYVYPDVVSAREGQGGRGLRGEYFRGRDLKRKVQTRVDPVLDFEGWPGDPSAADFGHAEHELVPLRWREGVRRFSYRRNPYLPSGPPWFDNVQIAFNALPAGEDGWMLSHLPGRVPKFTGYASTDYEYALNRVADDYGGGTEVWRLLVPGMPRKHFYPRQPEHPLEGAVSDARLEVTYREGTRIVECALPWGELPHVKMLRDAGETVKFSFRVNHREGDHYDLADGRSVAEGVSRGFHPDWASGNPNELTFGFER